MFIPTSYPKISILKWNFCQTHNIHISHITEGNNFQFSQETESHDSLHFEQLLKKASY